MFREYLNDTGCQAGHRISEWYGKIERFDTKLTGEIKRMEDRLDANSGA
ncbi:MAG: hypothetical protein OXP09_10935 [Gammaproteobacteria bacterium]|nr:hypothetical protein [Gammaproteobacteria bacterium]